MSKVISLIFFRKYVIDKLYALRRLATPCLSADLYLKLISYSYSFNFNSSIFKISTLNKVNKTIRVFDERERQRENERKRRQRHYRHFPNQPIDNILLGQFTLKLPTNWNGFVVHHLYCFVASEYCVNCDDSPVV